MYSRKFLNQDIFLSAKTSFPFPSNPELHLSTTKLHNLFSISCDSWVEFASFLFTNSLNCSQSFSSSINIIFLNNDIAWNLTLFISERSFKRCVRWISFFPDLIWPFSITFNLSIPDLVIESSKCVVVIIDPCTCE